MCALRDKHYRLICVR